MLREKGHLFDVAEGDVCIWKPTDVEGFRIIEIVENSPHHPDVIAITRYKSHGQALNRKTSISESNITYVIE